MAGGRFRKKQRVEKLFARYSVFIAPSKAHTGTDVWNFVKDTSAH
jgi:hypothetical protein